MKTLLTIAFIALSSFAHAAHDGEMIQVETHGLVCDFCARGVEKTLLRHPGIAHVEVNLTQKRVTVHTKAGQTPPSDAELSQMLTSAGYTAHAITRKEAGHEE